MRLKFRVSGFRIEAAATNLDANVQKLAAAPAMPARYLVDAVWQHVGHNLGVIVS